MESNFYENIRSQLGSIARERRTIAAERGGVLPVDFVERNRLMAYARVPKPRRTTTTAKTRESGEVPKAKKDDKEVEKRPPTAHVSEIPAVNNPRRSVRRLTARDLVMRACIPILRKLGGLSRLCTAVALQATGAVLALTSHEPSLSSEVGKRLSAAVSSARAVWLVTAVTYANYIVARGISRCDLGLVTTKFREACLEALELEPHLTRAILHPDVTASLVCCAWVYLFSLGMENGDHDDPSPNDDSNNPHGIFFFDAGLFAEILKLYARKDEAEAGNEAHAPARLWGSVEECVRLWNSCRRAGSFHESAALVLRAGMASASSLQLLCCAAASGFNSSAGEGLGSARAAVLVTTALSLSGIEDGIMHAGLFSSVSAMDELWRRIRLAEARNTVLSTPTLTSNEVRMVSSNTSSSTGEVRMRELANEYGEFELGKRLSEAAEVMTVIGRYLRSGGGAFPLFPRAPADVSVVRELEESARSSFARLDAPVDAVFVGIRRAFGVRGGGGGGRPSSDVKTHHHANEFHHRDVRLGDHSNPSTWPPTSAVDVRGSSSNRGNSRYNDWSASSSSSSLSSSEWDDESSSSSSSSSNKNKREEAESEDEESDERELSSSNSSTASAVRRLRENAPRLRDARAAVDNYERMKTLNEGDLQRLKMNV